MRKVLLLVVMMVLCASLASAAIVVQDSFNRSNRALNGDTADNGQTWTSSGATIASNRLSDGIPTVSSFLLDKEYNTSLHDDEWNFTFKFEQSSITDKTYVQLKDSRGILISSVLLAGTGNLRVLTVPTWEDIMAYSANTEYHIRLTEIDFTSENYRLWVDGVDKGYKSFAAAATQSYENATSVTFLRATGGTGLLDEIYTFFGAGGSPPATTYPNLHIKAYDFYDNSSASNFTVTLDNGTDFTTTNGTVIINNVTRANYTFNITDIAGITGKYFNLSKVPYHSYINASANDTTYSRSVYPHQSFINFSSYELISGDLLPASSYYLNGSSGTSFKLKSALNYLILSENAGYFNKSQTFGVSPLDNLTINVTGVYSSILNISATNAYTGNPIINFSGWIYHPGSANNRTFNTTNGTYYAPMIPGNFTIYLESEGYAIGSDNYENITINETAHNLSFSLYSNNSIMIFIRNENTGLLITDNITITVTGANETQYYTSNGTRFIQDLTDGNYSVKFSGDNYTVRAYSVTVAERSTQILNAYLVANSEEVIMSYIDSNSGTSLEGVSASMSRLIGGVWTVVQSKDSDITGRIQFSYIPDVKYKFTSSLTDYDSKIFYLDPVIFESYNVLMSKETIITNAPDYQGVAITITPSVYYNDGYDNFTITFNSPDGLFSSYSYNITFPTGGFYSGSGVNAYGGTFDHDINITLATIFDTVILEYTYDTTIGSPKTHRQIYSIQDPTAEDGTFIKNKSETYGLGVFERILVTVLVVIILTGILSLTGGILIGAPVGLLVMGYLTYIGFMPLWAALPSLFVGFILIASRSS